MQSLGGIDYLIMGGKGTNLRFEDHKFKNQKSITYNIKSFKLQLLSLVYTSKLINSKMSTL